MVCSLAACASPETRVIDVVSVINWYPSGNATCIPTDTEIWITFSASLEESSITDSTVLLSRDSVAVTVERTYFADTATVHLLPTGALDYGADYLIQLDPQLTSVDGDELGVQVESTFHTVPQQGCSGALDCLVDNDCTAQICSVVGLCVDECVVPEDCGGSQTCVAGSCQ